MNRRPTGNLLRSTATFLAVLVGVVVVAALSRGEPARLRGLSGPSWSAAATREASRRVDTAVADGTEAATRLAGGRAALLAGLDDAPALRAIAARVDSGSCDPSDLDHVARATAQAGESAPVGALELLAGEVSRCLGDRSRARDHYREAAHARADLASYAWRRSGRPARATFPPVDVELASLGAAALGSLGALMESGDLRPHELRAAASAIAAATPSGWLSGSVERWRWELLTEAPAVRVALRARWLPDGVARHGRAIPALELLAVAPTDPVARSAAIGAIDRAIRAGEDDAAREIASALRPSFEDRDGFDAWLAALGRRSDEDRERDLRDVAAADTGSAALAAWSLVGELRRSDRDAEALAAVLDMRTRFPTARPDEAAVACAVLAGTLGEFGVQRTCLDGIADLEALGAEAVDIAADRLAAGAWGEALTLLASTEPTAESSYWRGRALELSGRPHAAVAAYREAWAAAPLSYHGILADGRLTRADGGSKHRRLIAAIRDSSPGWSVEESGRSAMVLAALGLSGAARDEAYYQAQLFGPSVPLTAALAAELLAERGEEAEALWLLGRHVPMSSFPRETLALVPGRVLQIAYPTPYDKEVAAAAAESGIDRGWVLAVARRESGFDPDAVSRAGARGLMQVRRSTGRRAAGWLGEPRRIGRRSLHDPALNVRLGASVLASVEGCAEVATASYAVGAGLVRTWRPDSSTDADLWLARTPYPTVRRYIEEVLAARAVYAALLGDPELPGGCRVEPLAVSAEAPGVRRDR